MFLKRWVEFTIERRGLILVFGAGLIVAGTLALMRLPFDAFPDTTPVMVQVNASAAGWAPEELERQVTFPMERVLAGLAGLTEVRSISKYGLSQVTLIFEDEIDVYLARQQVTERLVGIELPDGVDEPQLGPISTGLGEVFHYIVLGNTEDPTEARTVQDWLIKPQLQAVPGVAEVNSWGGFEKQYHVVVDPNRLAQYDISMTDVIERLTENVRNVAGGEMNRGGEQTVVRGVGMVTNRQEIGEIVIDSREGVPVHVHDVADVVIGHEIRRGATTYDGQGEAVLGLGFMLTGQNSGDITRRLAERLEEIRPSLPEGIEVRPVYQRTDLVRKVLRTVEHNLLFGAALVIAVLFAFLGNIRAGLIVASTIPLSMLFAFDMMSRLGIAGSLMSLGAIDFGLAADNAVIQVENSVRRLAEPHAGRSRFQIICDAIMEVRKPTLFGELIIIIVYLPILTLQGIEGKMFRPMALTVVLVLLGSFILSFTVVPALIAAFMSKRVIEREPWLVHAARRMYRPVLDWALRRRRAVLGVALALLAGGAALFTTLGGEFVPRLSEGTIAINLVRLAGVSLDQSVDYSRRIESILRDEFPDEIEHIWTRTGTAELATDPMGLEVSDVFITLTPRDRWKRAGHQQELVSLMDATLEDLPGFNRVFTQPIEMRVNEMIAGIRSDVGIKLFGDDLEVLASKADEIAALVGAIEGSADVTVEQLTGQPHLDIQVDRARLARFGMPADEVLNVIESFGGVTVGEVFEGQRRFDLSVRMDPRYRTVPEDIERLPIQSGDGALLTLDRVTQPVIGSGPSTITREWGKRRIVIQTNVRGRDIASFVDELRERIAGEIDLSPGYYVRFGGQFENLERAQARLAIVVPLALLLIFGLLYWTYKSVRDALLIFSGVPLAVLGGVAALAARGLPFSISAGVGFIALSGIAVLNGLVLVSTIKRLRSEGVPLEQAVRESGMVRMRPVLMTALLAAFGFVPMVISTGVGAEVQRPLATVVVGGILTSTALSLIVLPVLYSVFGRSTESEE
ncbi:MAG: CusA/CzcA family heavy metal efflux RND transporter [Candidatus Zixiibacteriota bacterium]